MRGGGVVTGVALGVWGCEGSVVVVYNEVMWW